MNRLRRSKRFRTQIPIQITAGSGSWVLTPEEISVSGCGFMVGTPSNLKGSCTVVLPTSPPIETRASVVSSGLHRGFGIKWELTAEQADLLSTFLRHRSVEPSADAKAQYLATENRVIHAELQSIDEQRRAGFQLALVLIVAFFGYTIAPYRLFDTISVELAGFYAMTGLWISVILIYHYDRFTHFLGASVRHKTVLYRALSANRSWMFFNDTEYYARSVLPLGGSYDDGRAYHEEERAAQSITFNASTPIFMMFVQLLFVVGLIHFVGVILRIYDLRIINGQHTIPTNSGATDLLKLAYFTKAGVTCALPIMLWVQIVGVRYERYSQSIWEAHRISPGRPNPRFHRGALKVGRPRAYSVTRFLVGVVMLYALSCVLVLTRAIDQSTNIIVGHLFSPVAVAVVAAAFLAGKLVYAKEVVREASLMDANTAPLRVGGYKDLVQGVQDM